MFTDSHTHLFLKDFNSDRDEMIQRALEAGVTRMFLPNIDASTIQKMFDLCDRYPGNCFPMLGLHPTSVGRDYEKDLELIEKNLDTRPVIAIGETGMDLYRDKTYLKQQESAFGIQIRWARERDLPVVIHARESFREIFHVLEKEGGGELRGVFHSFTGNQEELKRALSFGFMIGINGIVTFKNSDLHEVVSEIPLERILLETDAPFLAPVPHRGKRNESSYLPDIAVRVAEIHDITIEELGEITSGNSEELFRIHGLHNS